jgi:hypothetical protein
LELIKNLYWFGGVFTFGIVGMMGFAFPHTLRFFRLPRMYRRALIISIILLIIGILLQLDENYDCLERRNLLYPTYGILFLLLYKISDNYIQKKLGRQMYYLTMFQLRDEESSKSTWLENIIQIGNLIASFALPYYASMEIIRLLYYC